MLAREMKIKSIKRQREHIRKLLSTERKDGVTSRSFVGEIFPEVKSYFEKEGYCITPVQSDILCAITQGQPVHLFTLDNDYRKCGSLSDEEKKQAEEYQGPVLTADNLSAEDIVTDIIKKFLT